MIDKVGICRACNQEFKYSIKFESCADKAYCSRTCWKNRYRLVYGAETPTRQILKSCRFCLKEKPADQMIKNWSKRTGYDRICHECAADIKRRARHAPPPCTKICQHQIIYYEHTEGYFDIFQSTNCSKKCARGNEHETINNICLCLTHLKIAKRTYAKDSYRARVNKMGEEWPRSYPREVGIK